MYNVPAHISIKKSQKSSRFSAKIKSPRAKKTLNQYLVQGLFMILRYFNATCLVPEFLAGVDAVRVLQVVEVREPPPLKAEPPRDAAQAVALYHLVYAASQVGIAALASRVVVDVVQVQRSVPGNGRVGPCLNRLSVSVLSYGLYHNGCDQDR